MSDESLKSTSTCADSLIQCLEAHGLGWSLDHTGNLIEVRIWNWPFVIARYRPDKVEPLARMLSGAMQQIPWKNYPLKKLSVEPNPIQVEQ